MSDELQFVVDFGTRVALKVIDKLKFVGHFYRGRLGLQWSIQRGDGDG